MKFRPASASVLGREVMRDLDARTIAAGTASLVLMERAGEAIAEALGDEQFHGVKLPAEPSLLVLAGRGNNGGDGFVVARLLAARGWRCTVALLGGEPGEGDAAVNLAAWRRASGSIVGADEAARLVACGLPDLILDAVYGTGLTRPVEEPLAALFASVNDSGLPVVAADIASGLDSDSGQPLGVAVRARATVTLGAAKAGLFLAEGPDYSGRVRVADIGLLDPASLGFECSGVVLDAMTTAGAWPRLSPLAHKGSRGHVLVVAGSRGKTGAAVLAARAALRAGAGLVTVAGVAEVQTAVSASLPEAMTLALAGDSHGVLDASCLGELAAAVSSATSIVTGPGLGRGEAVDAALELLLASRVPIVLDADALATLAGWESGFRQEVFASRQRSGAPRPILTPHPGEMARLASTTNHLIQASRKIFAAKLAAQLDSVVVLKGAATIVAGGPGNLTAYNLSGNAAMAAAGMGDVLAGVCGSLAARLADPFDAACLAVWVHGAAGDALAARSGPGILASEVADAVPGVLASRLPR